VRDELRSVIVSSWVGVNSQVSLAGVSIPAAAESQEEGEDLGVERRVGWECGAGEPWLGWALGC